MPSMKKYLVAVVMAAAFTTTTAAEQQGACKDDVAKLCKDVQPGEGRVLQCLKEHQADVSPACKNRLKQVKQQMKALSDACDADVEKFCWDTPVGKGGIANCLKKHSAELSAECKSAVAAAKSKSKSAKTK
jgi:hypothetical protein